MANKVRNTSRPQNVLAKESKIDHRITDELLPILPSFIADYNSYLDGQGRSVRTREEYIKDLTGFLEYMASGTGLTDAASIKEITLSDIDNLKGRDINDYLSYIKRYEAEDGTIMQNGDDARARKRSSIVGLLKFLYRQDMIEQNVTEKVMPISVKASSRTVKALQENEAAELLDVVTTGSGLTDRQLHYWELTKYRDKLIIALLSIAGLRVSELQQLNISSFNLKREEFTIYRKRGKESVIPLNRTLIDILNEYMENDRRHCPDVAPGNEDALFLSLPTDEKDAHGNIRPTGRKRLSDRQIRALVHKYTAVVIGGSGYSPHKLRATAATTAIQRGNDLSRVAALLDHDSVTTTQRYVHTSQEDKRRVMASMEQGDNINENQSLK